MDKLRRRMPQSYPTAIDIQYAHCVKFTPGLLDVWPHSQYELMVEHCTITELYADRYYEATFWIRTANGYTVAIEDSAHDAIYAAQYCLMSDSRASACRKAMSEIEGARHP